MKKKLFLTGLVIAVATALADQYSKYYIFKLLANTESKEIQILPFFKLVMVQNFGVSFGMFNDIAYGQLILSAVAICITIGLLIWMWRMQKSYMVVAMGLIIGGAVGNITDRLLYGAVADFLDFYWESYHWPAFNIADSAVFVGVVMILMENFFTDNGENNAKGA